jgi:exopolysaccharide biosynthesis protein
MTRTSFSILLLLLFAAAPALAHWEEIAPGLDYRHFNEDGLSAHVSRVDLTSDAVRIVSSRPADRGMRTSDWAKKYKALVAINADYFDHKHNPIGLAIGSCVTWDGTKDTRREGVLAVGKGRAEISPQAEVLDPVPSWVEQAVSGWPLLIDECKPFGSARLPGSDGFTRSPHPRTAVGVSRDGRHLFLVVVDGRKEEGRGATLAQLASFMHEKLGACRALNLDGGGSSTMVIDGKVASNPSGGEEKWVANHLGVVLRADYPGCDVASSPRASSR